MFSFLDLYPDTPDIHIIDVGASPIEGTPIYQSIIEKGGFHLTGFEPNPVMIAELEKEPHPNMTFLPYALGDGSEVTLNICAAPGMSSVFEPDLDLLSNFHGFEDWSRIVEKLPMSTRRLDDIEEIQSIDFLKLDVQGSELNILKNAKNKLKHTQVIYVETLFVPFYKNQPLFGDIDVFLRECGFMFHKFGPMASRIFKPLIVNNNIYQGMSQVLWSDAVYVKPFTRFDNLMPDELLKIARIMHDVFGSFDLAQLALKYYDTQKGSHRQMEYISKLTSIQ